MPEKIVTYNGKYYIINTGDYMIQTILHYTPDADPECLHGASGGVVITDSESVMLAEFASINTEIIDDLGRFILVSEDFYYNFISTNHCEEYIV